MCSSDLQQARVGLREQVHLVHELRAPRVRHARRRGETVVTEAVIQKSDQCTNTSRYQYSYEVVWGERQAVLKQAEMLPIGTHELFDIE